MESLRQRLAAIGQGYVGMPLAMPAVSAGYEETNVWQVVRAASTKPFGFLPFHPGPGVGGHRLPIDPTYLERETRWILDCRNRLSGVNVESL
jgi:UDP-N-acetyl-D-mannosaminuronate dehydrogenase